MLTPVTAMDPGREEPMRVLVNGQPYDATGAQLTIGGHPVAISARTPEPPQRNRHERRAYAAKLRRQLRGAR